MSGVEPHPVRYAPPEQTLPEQTIINLRCRPRAGELWFVMGILSKVFKGALNLATGGIGGAVLSGAGALIAGKKQNKIAGQQADATVEAARLSADVQRQNFLDTTKLYQPRAQAGDAATARMLQIMGLPVPQALTSGSAYDSIGSGGGGGFDAGSYLKANPDVQQAFGNLGPDDKKYMRDQGYEPTLQNFAEQHWKNSGQAEGRSLGVGQVNGLSGNALDVPDLGEGGVSELIKSTPGYKFRFGEGMRAIEGSAASRGRLMSGSAIRRLQEFGDDYASREFGNYWSRLSGIAGAGQTATQGIAGAGANSANNLSQIYQNKGANLASSYGNQTSTFGNALGVAGGALAKGYG